MIAKAAFYNTPITPTDPPIPATSQLRQRLIPRTRDDSGLVTEDDFSCDRPIAIKDRLISATRSRSSSSTSTASSSSSISSSSASDSMNRQRQASGYLPLPGTNRARSSRGSAIVAWLFGRFKIILGLVFLTLVCLQAIALIPHYAGEDRMKNWGMEGMPHAHPPSWLDWHRPPIHDEDRPPPPHPGEDWDEDRQPDLHRPPHAHPPPPAPPANPNALPHGYPAPYDSLMSDRLGLDAQAWPPKHSAQYNDDYTAAKLYPDGHNPHTGEIPPLQLSILNAPRVAKRPPRPPTAPAINASIWTASPWSREKNGSKSSFDDALLNAHLQQGEADNRPDEFAGWRPPLAALAPDAKKAKKGMERVQFAFKDPSRRVGAQGLEKREATLSERQRLVKAAFLHSWDGYKQIAWGHDEMKPVSEVAQDPFNGWGATIVDALDTLLVMDLPEEYDLARQHVRDIDFHTIGGERSAYGSQDGRIPVFETAIRYLGGFLAAYDLSGDELMKDRAEELAQLLSPAFDTKSGVPVGRVRFGSPRKGYSSGGGSILAEAGSMLLEFTRLWQVTGNRTYFDRVQRTTDWLDHNMTESVKLGGGLLPTSLFPESGAGYGTYSFGGMCDSYYEYLIKEHQLMGGRLPQYSRMYSAAIDSAKRWLIRDISTVPFAPLVAFGHSSRNHWEPKMEHLACFTGGMMGLGSKLMPERAQDIQLARRITETCWWTYNSSATGIGPEDTVFYQPTDSDRWQTELKSDGTRVRAGPSGWPLAGVRRQVRHYLGRPETIESVFYMWRITGDPVWQDRGWQMFASWVTHAMTAVGFANINDVTRVPAVLSDNMESFVFAETFKYYYLLFSPPDLISLDDYVFTTEAHPLLLPKKGRWTRPAAGPKSFWDASTQGSASSTASQDYSGGEDAALPGSLTNVQKHNLYNSYIARQEALRAAEERAKAKAKLVEAVQAARAAGTDAVGKLAKRLKDWVGRNEEGDGIEGAQAQAIPTGLQGRSLNEKEETTNADQEASPTTDPEQEKFHALIRQALEMIQARKAVVSSAEGQQQDDEPTESFVVEDRAAGVEKNVASAIIETEEGPMEIRFETNRATGPTSEEILLGKLQRQQQQGQAADEPVAVQEEQQASPASSLACSAADEPISQPRYEGEFWSEAQGDVVRVIAEPLKSHDDDPTAACSPQQSPSTTTTDEQDDVLSTEDSSQLPFLPDLEEIRAVGVAALQSAVEMLLAESVEKKEETVSVADDQQQEEQPEGAVVRQLRHAPPPLRRAGMGMGGR